MRLGDMLLKAGVVTPLQLNAALAEQGRWGGKLGRILVRMGALSDELLAMALARQLQLPRADLTAVLAVPDDLKERLDLLVCDKYRVLPLAWIPDRRVVQIAMSDPLDVVAIDDIRRRVGAGLEIFVVGDEALDAALRRLYGAAQADSLTYGAAPDDDGLDLIDNSGKLRRPRRTPAEAGQPSAPPRTAPAEAGAASLAARLDEHVRLRRAVTALLVERGVIRPGEVEL